MVTKINVVDNQKVKTGDLLFEIDPSQYQVKLNQANRLQRTREAAKGTKIELNVLKVFMRKTKVLYPEKSVRNETNYL